MAIAECPEGELSEGGAIVVEVPVAEEMGIGGWTRGEQVYGRGLNLQRDFQCHVRSPNYEARRPIKG
jgi:hypothetical protein